MEFNSNLKISRGREGLKPPSFSPATGLKIELNRIDFLYLRWCLKTTLICIKSTCIETTLYRNDRKPSSTYHDSWSQCSIENSKSIILTFVRRDVRDSSFKAKKQLFDATSRDLVLQRVAEQKIFIAESLTQRNKKVFTDCIKAKHDLNFKYIWPSWGKMMLRKDDDRPARLTSCDGGLVKLRKS